MASGAFLFDPAKTAKLLAGFPHLRVTLADPAQEGKPSGGFPQARKSEREIYRVLSNVHYPHLEALLRSLDFCIERGFTQPTLLRTRARTAFIPALSELHVAEHFLLRGFEVEGLDQHKGSDPVPELVARRDGLALAVEVYCPREWEGLAELMDELKDAVKNLDLPFDYEFAVRADQLERFDAQQRLVHIHPGILARALDAGTRERIVGPLVEELTARLEEDAQDMRVETDERELNIKVTIEVTGVEARRFHLPARSGVISPPGLSGHAPERMFDRLVHRRVRAKAAKGQAPGSGLAPLSLLIVDLVHSELTSELVHPTYRADFEQTLQDRLRAGLLGYDLVAFCESHTWGRELRLHFLMQRDGVPEGVRGALFGGQLATD